jgi:hypothetical protein
MIEVNLYQVVVLNGEKRLYSMFFSRCRANPFAWLYVL